ncbi:response regulator, partial [uncultured Psychrosphaera sp.]|uniref:response regulator n=1 Tax=uncultured Psychrosphaera sp. TaxID=1403522 RepID=UPI0030F66785
MFKSPQYLETQKILIIDDSLQNVLFLQNSLSDLADIHFSLSGIEGLAMANKMSPDIIILDIAMPEMDGWQVCTELKSNPVTQAIPIIFITGVDQPDAEELALAQGAIDFITKPFDPKICHLRVKNQLKLVSQSKILQHAEQALFYEKERLRITLESIGDAVIATDTKGYITFMNPIAERMTGWHFKKGSNHKIEEVMLLRDSNSKEPILNPVYIALSDKRIAGMALNSELLSHTLNVYSVEDSAAPINNAAGETIGAIIVFHDVSEATALALKMSHLANYDQLTDLPNSILLQDR